MFTNNLEVPADVREIVRMYKEHPGQYELQFYGDIVVLYEMTVTKVEGQSDTISLGQMVKRAYWSGLQFLSIDTAKGTLGIR